MEFAGHQLHYRISFNYRLLPIMPPAVSADISVQVAVRSAASKASASDGLPTGLSLAALGGIVAQFDNFLIGTFVGYTTLGFYDRAYRIAHWPNLLLTVVITRIGFLTFARVQNDAPRLAHTMRLSLWVLTTLGIPIALFLFFAAPDVVQVLYGPTWSESAYYLRFLTIYSLVSPFINTGFWLAVALGHRRIVTGFTGIQAALLILLGTLFAFTMGGIGDDSGRRHHDVGRIQYDFFTEYFPACAINGARSICCACAGTGD